MGADMLLVSVQAPMTEEGVQLTDFNLLRHRVTAATVQRAKDVFAETEPWGVVPQDMATRITDGTVTDLDWEHLVLDLVHALFCGQTKTITLSDGSVRPAHWADEGIYERQITEYTLKGITYVMTGGLSHGDYPTEMCEVVNFLDQLALFDELFPASAGAILPRGPQGAIPKALEQIERIDDLLDGETSLDALGIMEVQNRIEEARKSLSNY